jgi:GT2 family glycosyltransferase
VSASAPDFAIVTVAHNSEADLARLLDSLARLAHRPRRVVVVDSGSSDSGAELAAARGVEVVDLGGNRGFGAGCNAGLEPVTEPVTALVNPDVELLDAGLETLVSEAAGRDALIVPRLLNRDGTPQDSAHPPPGTLEDLVPALLPRGALPGPIRRRYEPWRSEQPRRVGWAIAACMVARTALLRRLGPFDPDAFLFYEDMELCLRAARAGVPTLLRPQVAVRHLGGTSVGPAFGGADLELRARRRREVLAAEGRRALALDDAAQWLTFATRAAARRALRHGGEHERAQLGALRRARAPGRARDGS